jgi:hypothetical protein
MKQFKKFEEINNEELQSYLKFNFVKFIFGSEDSQIKFNNHIDHRFSLVKNQQIKSLYLELKEDEFPFSWRNFIDAKTAFSLGDYQSYLTQGYQKHIHNITKSFVNKEGDQFTFYVSEKSLISEPGTQKFVDEHRENQYKVLNHIMENISKMSFEDFFDLMDESRKCNIVTVSENSSLQKFQLESKIGEWKNDYKQAKVNLIDLCDSEKFMDFFLLQNETLQGYIVKNLENLRKRNFARTKEILEHIFSIIDKKQ